jgi:hypothetical protein
MDDRSVHPYRQMRVLAWVAGGIAALIVLAALGLRVSGRYATSKPEPVETVHRFSEGFDFPAGVDAAPAPPKTFPSGPLSFFASGRSCFGQCVDHTTSIDATGHVKLTMSQVRAPLCEDAAGPTVSDADLVALAEHARSIHMERMRDAYMHATGVAGMRTQVSNGTGALSIMHEESAASDAPQWRNEAAAVEDLHKHIERLAGTEQWVKTCKRF